MAALAARHVHDTTVDRRPDIESFSGTLQSTPGPALESSASMEASGLAG